MTTSFPFPVHLPQQESLLIFETSVLAVSFLGSFFAPAPLGHALNETAPRKRKKRKKIRVLKKKWTSDDHSYMHPRPKKGSEIFEIEVLMTIQTAPS
jgi:hypothetical protein